MAKKKVSSASSKKATITRILKKVNQEKDKRYSLGFKRMSALPQRLRNKINLAVAIKGEKNTNSVKNMLNNFSEKEFINWLRMNL